MDLLPRDTGPRHGRAVHRGVGGLRGQWCPIEPSPVGAGLPAKGCGEVTDLAAGAALRETELRSQKEIARPALRLPWDDDANQLKIASRPGSGRRRPAGHLLTRRSNSYACVML